MVLIAREDRRAVFEYLLREGVIVVKKDAYLPHLTHRIPPSSSTRHHRYQPHLASPQGHDGRQILEEQGLPAASTRSTPGGGCTCSSPTRTEGLQYLIKELGLVSQPSRLDSKILPATHQKKRLVPKNEAGTEKVDDEGEEKPTKGE